MFRDKKWGDARLQNDPVLKQEWLKQLRASRQSGVGAN